MFRQPVDAGGQQGDLDLGGAGIVGAALVFLDYRFFVSRAEPQCSVCFSLSFVLAAL